MALNYSESEEEREGGGERETKICTPKITHYVDCYNIIIVKMNTSASIDYICISICGLRLSFFLSLSLSNGFIAYTMAKQKLTPYHHHPLYSSLMP